MVAVPVAAPRSARVAPATPPAAVPGRLPIVHILIPSDVRDADRGSRRRAVQLLVGEHGRGARRHRHRSARAEREADPRRVLPAEHPGEGSHLAAPQHARRQRVGEARRAAYALARHARSDSAERQGAVPDDRRRRRRLRRVVARGSRGPADLQEPQGRACRTRARPLHAGPRRLRTARRGVAAHAPPQPLHAVRDGSDGPAARRSRSHAGPAVLVRLQPRAAAPVHGAARSACGRARVGLPPGRSPAIRSAASSTGTSTTARSRTASSAAACPTTAT